ncbi:MAG: OB-fold nucleic acid binding domain-containing protein, partial [Atribacterota bacterium]|nr:OB-fold nucleic acid binding domain-containing protein [Atribacterota bacterium]
MDIPWVSIGRISDFEGKVVELRGWLSNKRSSGKVAFLIIRDGSGFIQGTAFVGDFFTKDQLDEIKRIPIESSILIQGKVRREERAPGGYELEISSFQLVFPSEEYPIQKMEHSVDYLMERRHLWLRSKKQNALLRIRNVVMMSIHEFLQSEGFILLDSPILTPAACEGTSTLFELQYFDIGKAYLSQSGQLYMEAG